MLIQIPIHITLALLLGIPGFLNYCSEVPAQEAIMNNRPQIIMATVYLRSQSGQSLMSLAGKPPKDLAPYLATPETRQTAISELEELGFTIEAQGVTLSISGPPELFEQVCNVEISMETIQSPTPDISQSRPFNIPRSSEPVMRIPELENVIEGLVLATPGVPF